jgi:hypothetical protein
VIEKYGFSVKTLEKEYGAKMPRNSNTLWEVLSLGDRSLTVTPSTHITSIRSFISGFHLNRNIFRSGCDSIIIDYSF